MHVKITTCVAVRKSLEESEVFFVRADLARDAVENHIRSQPRGNKLAISSYMKINGSSAHVEFDIKGSCKDICTGTISAINKSHEIAGDETPSMSSPMSIQSMIGRVTPPPAAKIEKAVEEIVQDD